MPARLIRPLLRMLLACGLLAGIAPVPASALTVSLSSPSLQFSPSGPYNEAHNAAVGTVLATASSTLNVNGLSATCTLNTVFLSNSAASGNTFTSGLAGIGVNFYYVVGGTQTQIDPTISLSLLLTTASPGPVTILAKLVVTGPVSSGSMSALPSLGIVFAGLGLGCGTLNVTAQTLMVTDSNATVTSVTCTVPTPNLTVTLPTVSAQTLSTAGQTGGAVSFAIQLNCGSAGAGVYVTLTDANQASNTSSLLSLTPSSTATNVGLQLLNSAGTLISYGPDSANAGNVSQWYVGPSASVTSLPLTVRYYATAAAGAGTVSALATFTLSYQ